MVSSDEAQGKRGSVEHYMMWSCLVKAVCMLSRIVYKLSH